MEIRPYKAFQTDEVAVSHLLQTAQKLRHGNFAVEQRRYVLLRAAEHMIGLRYLSGGGLYVS